MSKNLRLMFGGLCLLVLSTFIIASPYIPRAGGQSSVTLVNDDSFGNNVKVIDKNAGDAVVFNGYIAAHAEQSIPCRVNDSGYCNIATSKDNKGYIGRSLLKPGERVSL